MEPSNKECMPTNFRLEPERQHNLGSKKIISNLQQNNNKVPALPPWKSFDYPPTITVYTFKSQIRDNIKMSTWNQTSSISVRPKNITKT